MEHPTGPSAGHHMRIPERPRLLLAWIAAGFYSHRKDMVRPRATKIVTRVFRITGFNVLAKTACFRSCDQLNMRDSPAPSRMSSESASNLLKACTVPLFLFVLLSLSLMRRVERLQSTGCSRGVRVLLPFCSSTPWPAPVRSYRGKAGLDQKLTKNGALKLHGQPWHTVSVITRIPV